MWTTQARTLFRRDPHPSWTEARQHRHHLLGVGDASILGHEAPTDTAPMSSQPEMQLGDAFVWASGWRISAKAIAVCPHGCLDRRFFPRRWIMLRDAAPPGSDSSRRRFLNVSTGECVHTELPELDGYRLLGATAEGLLALFDNSTYAVRLLNPLTRQLVELPSLAPMLPAETRHEISRYGLAYAVELVGLGLAGDATVALCFHMPRILVVAKPGDNNWMLVDSGRRWIYSAMSFADRFYCADKSAVMALELTADQPPRLVVVAKITFGVSLMCRDTVQLVEGAGGELFLLHSKLLAQRYKAFRVDLDARKTVPVRGAGGLAVFLGKGRALSVPPGVFPTIRANTVYLGFDLRERSEKVSAYCVLNGRIERSTFSQDDGWTRPCRISDYLSWYVSGTCGGIEEI